MKSVPLREGESYSSKRTILEVATEEEIAAVRELEVDPIR